jgi:hypothetical protein
MASKKHVSRASDADQHHARYTNGLVMDASFESDEDAKKSRRAKPKEYIQSFELELSHFHSHLIA